MNSNQQQQTPGSQPEMANEQQETNTCMAWLTDTIIVNGAPMTVIYPTQEDEQNPY